MNIIMPQLGLTMEEGTVEVWLRREGDAVRKGEIIAEISTDKATTELEAPEDGTLEQILVGEGILVPVGEVLAVLTMVAENVGIEPKLKIGSTVEAVTAFHPSPALVVATLAQADSAEKIEEPTIRVSPLARRIAQENKLELTLLLGKGTGPEGRIVEYDVVDYLETQAKATLSIEIAQPTGPVWEEASFKLVPLNPVRATTARRLAEAARTTVPVTLNSEIDVTRLVSLRKELLEIQDSNGSRITYTDLIVLTVCRALPQHPHLNSTFLEAEAGQKPSLKVWSEINLGLAIALEGTEGLVVPVIKKAQNLSLAQLSDKRLELLEKAQRGRLALSDYEGATFTVSNLGSYAVNSFNPVINLPQVAILGVGRIIRKPGLTEAGRVRPRHYLNLSLTFDHRAVDGAPAAAFLSELAGLLEKPLRLFQF